MIIFLSAKNILFLQAITLSESLENIVKNFSIAIIESCLGAIVLHGVLYLYDNRGITILGKKNGIQKIPLGISYIFQLGVQLVKRFVFSFCHV